MIHAIIEGTVFTIDKLNANGWRIPESEAQNAIETLKRAVVRVCSSRDEHACDRSGDRFSEIGRVVDAWREGEQVVARAHITDSVAARKLKEGTWRPTWSLFGTGVHTDGRVHNLNIESLTLVREPAYGEAEFTLAGSAIADASKVKVIELEDETVYTQKEVDELVAAAASKARADTLEQLTKQERASHIVEAMQKAGALKAEEVKGRTDQLMQLEEDVLASELASWQKAAQTVETSANKLDRVPLSDAGSSGLSVGKWNNDTKQWGV
ncbi:MAG: hypothetical protein ACXQS4_04835 [Methermicoccaceae archaeon]